MSSLLGSPDDNGVTTNAAIRETRAPRWAIIMAHAVPLVVLPSGLWRLAVLLGVPVGAGATGIPLAENIYIFGLSVVSEAIALLTLGLVRPWGEVLPRWIPVLGGRRVRPLAATIPAVVGGLAVIALCLWAVKGFLEGRLENFGTAVQQGVLLACYVPLVAWGPMVIILALAYHHRRTRGARA